jgi:hypothetical protein
VCTISGTSISFVGGGTCAINANQSGNGSYQAAPQALQSFTVAGSPPPKSPQSISFTSAAPSGAVAGGPTYAVTASASSGLAVAFSAAGSSAGVCTVSGSTVSFVGSGTCTINANQSGNGSYLAAAQVQQSFSIGRASQTITITSDPGNNVHPQFGPYTITATSTSGLAVVFTTDPSSAGVCSVSGSTVTLSAKGQCIIYADQPGNANWLPAPQAQQSFRVK